MKKILMIVCSLTFLLGSHYLMASQAFTQYCFPIGPYCSGGQTCSGDTCFGTTCVNCPGGCNAGTGLCNATYTISGTVYVDTNGNGFQDGGESGYNNATVNVGGVDTFTNAAGNYSRASMVAGTYSVTLTVPSGYQATTANPRSVTLGPNSVVNFGIQLVPPPACTGGMSSTSLNVQPGGTATLSVTSCTNENYPPGPVWNPDTNNHNPPPTVSGQTDTPTSSTVTWTAPNCPGAENTYVPQVTVYGPGGNMSYTTNITVPATFSLTAEIYSVTSVGACPPAPSNGVYYGSAISVNLIGGSLPPGGSTQSTSTGITTFTCLPSGNYQLTVSVPSGYTLIGTALNGAQSIPGNNPINSSPLSANSTATFCIAPINPWFQTDKGDVRFLNLTNPVPAGKLGSTDVTFPGIYYSSNSNVNLGFGTASQKNWAINNEYSYNADTENRNGGMSYDFYKSKAAQDGVTITSIPAGTLSVGAGNPMVSGVYETTGDIILNSYSHVDGQRVVLLVKGSITINTPINIGTGKGVLIIAARDNITIDDSIGTPDPINDTTLAQTTTQLDGYYTAQGNITIDGGKCSDGVTQDRRLNVGGALIANSLKPFSSAGTGTILNKRSACTSNLDYPSLYIALRPDLVLALTDFYKTSYTKWQEISP